MPAQDALLDRPTAFGRALEQITFGEPAPAAATATPLAPVDPVAHLAQLTRSWTEATGAASTDRPLRGGRSRVAATWAGIALASALSILPALRIG